MRWISLFLRFFFHILYHPFAWSYDLVAWTVSLGRWKDWIQTVVPFIDGTRVLELGHGPGHLQRVLRGLNLGTVGLDESRQMGFLAKRNLARSGFTQNGLIRGLGQVLPFMDVTFDTVIATFPAPYIFERGTLSEIRRVMKNGGRLIVLPAAWIVGTRPLEKFASWLFRVTGQAPSNHNQETTDHLTEPFRKAGFQVQTEQLEVKSSLVLIVIAEKRGINVQETT